jgi:putative ABC transport system permease protein
LLRPLPFPDSDQIVVVYDRLPSCERCPWAFETYRNWADASTVFAAIAGSAADSGVVTAPGDAERVSLVRVTASLEAVFRLPPALGRWFSSAEDRPNGPKVAVLADEFWRRRFSGDPHAVGRTLRIDATVYEIIGVMPAAFTHRRGDVFVPLQHAIGSGRDAHFLSAFARVKPEVTIDRAQRELTAITESLSRTVHIDEGAVVSSYYEVVVGSVVAALRMLITTVGLLLLVCCANVASLLMASSLARRRELTVRAALGATRWDLARQMMIEGVLLACIGGGLGMVLAAWASHAFVRLAGSALPRATSVEIDATVLAFAAAVAVGTGIMCAAWPVVRMALGSRAINVRDADLRAGGVPHASGFGSVLVVAEIAVAFALLVCAGLLVKDFVHLESKPVGLSSAGVVAFDVAPTGERFPNVASRQEFYRALEVALRRLPGIESVGFANHLPMSSDRYNGTVSLVGGNPWSLKEAPSVEFRWIGGDYLDTLKIPIVRGRSFTAQDVAGRQSVAILSARTAQRFWADQEPLGRRLTFGIDQSEVEVVGIAGDVLSYGPLAQTPYELYLPAAQQPVGAMTVVFRTTNGEPTAIVPEVRRAVSAIDRGVPVSHVRTLEQVVSDSVSQPRLLSSLASLFAAVTALLAAVGIYGVMAYNVRRGRREFGIRLALGAEPRRVRQALLVRGLKLGAAGILAGILVAWLLTRTMLALLPTATFLDPEVYAVTAIGVLLVATACCVGPARQASRADPMMVLRSE